MNKQINYVNCPICNKKTIWNKKNKFRPFCGKHCKLLDLYEWTI